MANRDYKNVKRFVDGISKEVEETMAGGGTGGLDITPFVLIKKGVDVKVDFSKCDLGIPYAASSIDNYNLVSDIAWSEYKEASLYLVLSTNEGYNQLIAEIANYDGNYQTITNKVVIYEGDLSGKSYEDIKDTLPTVAFNFTDKFLAEDLVGVFTPYEELSSAISN